MKRFLLACLCLVALSGVTSAEEKDGDLKNRSEENIPGAASEPYIYVHESRDWSLLVCDVRGAFPKPKVEWKNGAGNIIPAEKTEVKEKGGNFDISLTITVNRTDYYRCVATQEEIKHRISAETYLHFQYAVTKPYVTSVEHTRDWALLRCEVRTQAPRPKIEWQDNAGNTLPTEDVSFSGFRDIFKIETTVTKTDFYRCVVTQEEINHVAQAKMHVYISGSPTGWIVAVVLLALAVVALAAAVVKLYITQSHKKGSPAETTVPLNS
ncbi:neogenin-like [Plectropomus leopardus]|uniref:neogenin-like n=1 Tax=Plectropomus leopardus TaxID=160734 RepID=UPI001C4C8D3E|nr:neogenin-like [Plectropomus leopardus]